MLPPLARSLTPLVGVPPLGALLVLVPITTPSMQNVLRLLGLARSYPWCPLLMPPVAHPAELAPHGVPASRVLVVDLDADPTVWRTAVQRRPLPTYEEWITALALRTEREVSDGVRLVFERATEGSSTRRQLRRLGLPSPGDCRDIHLGCVCLADALRTGDVIDVVARRHDLTGTRLSALAKRCFGMGWHELRAHGAWEPALEKALRFKKVVAEPVLPPSLPTLRGEMVGDGTIG